MYLYTILFSNEGKLKFRAQSCCLLLKWIPVAGNSSRIGNGYCDDENNNDECNFDAGDCYLDIVLTDYCTICQCLEG